VEISFSAALEGLDAVMRGEARAAFVACRPPGHHATFDGDMVGRFSCPSAFDAKLSCAAPSHLVCASSSDRPTSFVEIMILL
jgi:hypothetical protein